MPQKQKASAEEKVRAVRECLAGRLGQSEAAERWGKADRMVRQACTGYKGASPRFKEGEFCQSGKVWLITVEGMTRVFGPEPVKE